MLSYATIFLRQVEANIRGIVEINNINDIKIITNKPTFRKLVLSSLNKLDGVGPVDNRPSTD